jgi:hypothetical protein
MGLLTTETAMEQREKKYFVQIVTHPSGMSTSGFEVYAPNERQIASAARANDHYVPRRSLTPSIVGLTIWLVLMATLVGYLLVKFA